MNYRRLTLTAGVIATALAVACSDRPAPTAPNAVDTTTGDLGPGGSTLKIGAPSQSSPADGTQVDAGSAVTLSYGAVSGTYASFPVTYEIEVRNSATGALLASQKTTLTSLSVTTPLEGEVTLNWRVRATYNNLFGPWSATRTVRTLPLSYMRGNEIFDPLTNGRTAGQISGPSQWIPGVGLKLLQQNSHVTYVLPENLQAGEFSIMTTGVDDGSPGDKSKIMSMKEGFDDITTNDYRMTVELRGRNYAAPGAVSCRMITGAGDIFDCHREVLDISDTRWYFWKFTWQTGSARLELRADGPTGPILYAMNMGTGGRPYRPTPHVVHLGAPPGRAGDLDATIGGLVVKNVWFSSRPRPQFPQ
jgi:hypothetical protein